MIWRHTGGQVSTPFNVAENRWYGWVQVPAAAFGWAASPVLITKVTPLKSGKGLLRLHFLQPLWPGGGCQRDVTVRVVLHREDHLAASFEQDGIQHSVIIAAAEPAWLASYCPEHLQRRPVTSSGLYIDGIPLHSTTADQHLGHVFGTTQDEILAGATAESFAVEKLQLPSQVATFVLDVTYAPLDSLLIARGFIPQEMEEKWFVYMEAGHLLFRRSWTGTLIYVVEAEWRGHELYLGQVRANRDPEQYGETDDRCKRGL